MVQLCRLEMPRFKWVVFLFFVDFFQSAVTYTDVTCFGINGESCDYLQPYNTAEDNDDSGKEETVAINHLANISLLYIGSKLKKDGYDPYRLPSKTIDKLTLYDGTAVGLSKLVPASDTLLITSNDVVASTSSISLTGLKILYKWKRKILFYTLYGAVKVTIKKIILSARISQKLAIGNSPKLTAYTVNKIDGVTTDITGLGPFDLLVKSKVQQQLNAELTSFFNLKVPTIIKKHLSRIIL